MNRDLKYFFVKNSYLIFLLFLTINILPEAGFAQSCPKGVRYNCVHGCGRHTDNNGDGYCDYSIVVQPEKKEEQVVVSKDTIVALKPDTATGKTTVRQHSDSLASASTGEKGRNRLQQQKHGSGQPDNKNTETTALPSAGATVSSVLVAPPHATMAVPPKHEPVYDLIFVSIITLVLYFGTMLLYKREAIKWIHHRKIWNLLLLLTFLVSCLFGLFLVIQINYNVAMKAYGTLLYWHVEIGIAMTLIAVIHILWHITYFKKLLSKKW
jgi:hypothetical protein